MSESPTARVVPSLGQEGLWFLEHSGEAGLAYQVAWQHTFRGPLNLDALRGAVRHVVARHDVLRMVFREEEGRCRAELLPDADFSIPLTDLSAIAPADAQAEVARQCHAELDRRFDLAQGPLVRCQLFRLGPDDHVLLVMLHHIVIDGASAPIFRREMLEAYRALAAGRLPVLPAPAASYADFARAQRAELDGGQQAALLDYWRRQLDGCESNLYLPADRPAPAAPTGQAETLLFDLPPELLRQMRELSREHKVSLFVILLAAWQTLLMRMSNSRDIVVGAPFAGNSLRDTEPGIGYYINLLPLRTDLSGNPRFAELLPRVRDTVLQAIEHGALPFPQMVAALTSRQNRVRSPFFRVVLNVQYSGTDEVELPGVTHTVTTLLPRGTTHDLSLRMSIGPQRASGQLDYAREVFDETTIRLAGARFRQILESLVVDPRRRIEEVPLLLPGEPAAILLGNSAPGGEPPPPAVHRAVADQARRTPDRIAVIAEDRQVTYAGLEAEAERVAAHLVARGLPLGTPVGLYLDRSIPWVVGMLAILKAGGAYLPLDLENPPERTARILEESRCAWVLTLQALAARAAGPGRTLLLLDALAGQPAGATLPAATQPEDPAYVFYTSGSTGAPKGAVIPHRAIANHMHWMLRCFHVTADDVFLQKSPVGFDASVWEYFAPLMTGGRLVLARPGGHRDPEYLAETIQRHGVTLFQAVPTQFEMLVATPAFARCRTLRWLFSGGEALSTDLAERLRRLLPLPLANLYGPTEACINAACHVAREREPGAYVSIGRSIDNLRCYVLDSHRQPVPAGVAGELYVGGVGVGLGYLHQPGLTAERFLPDPFAPEPGARMYRTGDGARLDRDGTLAYLGRLDDQVKIRGVRVEPGEVAAVLGRDPRVTSCCVVARPDAQGQLQLVAYVVPAGPRPAAADLRAALARQLPAAMVPTQVVFLETLPLLPSGKVNRRALPAPTAPAAATAPVPPRTDNERVLADIWGRLLQQPAVGVQDDFFELGGHSLLATRLVAHIRQALQVEVPLRKVFECPTIAGLALWILEQQVRNTSGNPAALWNEIEIERGAEPA